METIRSRTDCEVFTLVGDNKVRGVIGSVPLALRARTALSVVVETYAHPLSVSIITIDPQNRTVTVTRERYLLKR